jgi:hypothetical protein
MRVLTQRLERGCLDFGLFRGRLGRAGMIPIGMDPRIEADRETFVLGQSVAVVCRRGRYLGRRLVSST